MVRDEIFYRCFLLQKLIPEQGAMPSPVRMVGLPVRATVG